MKKNLRWTAYLLLPVIILLLAAFLNLESISYFVFRKAAQIYAGRAGISLEIGAIHGKPFSETTLENITVHPESGTTQTYHFKSDSIACTYRLLDLRAGFAVFLQGLDCSATDPVLQYDSAGESRQVQAENNPVQFLQSAVFPGLGVHNGTVILSAHGWDAELRAINSRLRTDADGVQLQLRVGSFRFNQEGVKRIDTGFAASLRYGGEKITVDFFEMGAEKISAAGFIDLQHIDKGKTGFAADLAFGENILNISGAMESRLLRAQVKTENFDIGELQKRLGGTGWDVSGMIRGEAVFAYDLEADEILDGFFNLDLRDGKKQGFRLDTLSVSGSFDREILQIAAAEAGSPGNRLRISDVSIPTVPLLAAEPLPLLAGSRAKFSLDIGDIEPILQLIKVGDESLPEGVRPDDLTMQGSLEEGILHIAEAEANSAGNHILLNDISIPVEKLLTGDALPVLANSEGEFRVEITKPAPILELLKVSGNLPRVLEPEMLTIHGFLEAGALLLDEGRTVAADSSLSIDKAAIRIPDNIKTMASVPIDLQADFASEDLRGIAGLFGEIPLHGQVAAELYITGSIMEPEAAINLTGKNLVYHGKELGSLALLGNLQLRREPPGTVRSLQITVTELTQESNAGILRLSAPATGAWQADNFFLDAVLQVDDKGEIVLGVRQTSEKGITVQAKGRKIDSSGWLADFIDKRFFFQGADFEASFSGLPDNPEMMLAGTVAEAGATDVSFPMSGIFSLQYSKDGITVSEFSWKSRERNELTLAGHLPYDPLAEEPYLDGELSVKGYMDFPALEDIAVFLEPWGIDRGSITLDIDLTGSWNQPAGNILLQAEGLAPPDRLSPFMDSPVNLVLDIGARGDSIVLQSGSLEAQGYTAQATGSWNHGSSLRELLRNRKAELRGVVAADATVQFQDLNFLRSKVTWLRRLEGDMQARLKVSGPVSDPAISGSFTIKDGELVHTLNFPKLSAVNLQGDFDAHSLTIKRMQAEVGGAPVSLEGKINRERDSFAVSLHVDGQNVLLFRNNDMRMRGDVNLDVAGPLDGLVVEGTTALTSGYYTRNIDFLGMIGSSAAPVSEGANFLFSFPEKPLRDAVLDIKITTREPFRIRNNLIRGVLRPELSLRGTGELPFLVGNIYIDPSRVLLPSGRLQINSGLIRFLEEEPDRPQLDLVAQSKVLGYDINVITRGPFDDLVITLSSSPALPNDDLLLLLLTGQPPKQDVGGGTRRRSTTNVMVYLGRDFLSRWLEGETETGDETILDRFELDFGRDVTKSGEQTVEATFRLAEQEAGKRKVYYLSAEKDKYDAYNYGLKLVFRFE